MTSAGSLQRQHPSPCLHGADGAAAEELFWNTVLAKSLSKPGYSSGFPLPPEQSPHSPTRSINNCWQPLQLRLPPHSRHHPSQSCVASRKPFLISCLGKQASHFLLPGMRLSVSLVGRVLMWADDSSFSFGLEPSPVPLHQRRPMTVMNHSRTCLWASIPYL